MTSPSTKKLRIDRGQLAALGVAGGMMACFIGLLYVPNTQTLGEAQAQLLAAQGQLREAEILAAQLPPLAGKVADEKAVHERRLAQVPEQSDAPRFMGSVLDILRDEGIAQRELTPQAARPKGDYVEQPLALSFEATAPQAYRVLARLEGLPRINHVESVRLVALPGAEGRVRAEVCVVIYYSLSSKTAANPPAGAKTGGNS